MDALVDSCIWSVNLRGRGPDLINTEKIVDELIAHSRSRITRIGMTRIGMIGAIRQECLSGLPDPNHYARIRAIPRAFVDIPLVSDDYELAAFFVFNTCRSKGVQGSHIDFLICAVADREKLQVFTTDRDFDRYAKMIPIRRFKP